MFCGLWFVNSDSFFGRFKKHAPLNRVDPSTPLRTSTIASACAFGMKKVLDSRFPMLVTRRW